MSQWQRVRHAKETIDGLAEGLGRGEMPEMRRSEWTAFVASRRRLTGLSLFVVAVVVAAVLVHVAQAPGPRYSVSVGGTVPAVETVGRGFSLPITVANTGRAIPGLTLDVAGCTDHWVLNGVRPVGRSSGSYYELGSLRKSGRLGVSVGLVPRDAGNHTCRLKMWEGALSHGVPSGDEIASLSTTVAIDP